jgi:hypothetical protein
MRTKYVRNIIFKLTHTNITAVRNFEVFATDLTKAESALYEEDFPKI